MGFGKRDHFFGFSKSFQVFIKTWKDFEKPKKWSRLPNPISHRDSFMMSDYLRLAMIMPYILQRFLKVSLLHYCNCIIFIIKYLYYRDTNVHFFKGIKF